MSGGSFDYLYGCDPEQLAARLEDVERMAKRLRDKGCSEAAKETERLAEHLRATSVKAPNSLREMWRTMEWRDSSDYGDEELHAAYAVYLRRRYTDAIEGAWGLIANAGGGDWNTQSEDWRQAAARWRNQHLTLLNTDANG